MCNLVLTQLDYSNGMLYGASEYVIGKLQKVENFAAKMVLNRNILLQRLYLTGKFVRVLCKHYMTYICCPYMPELILRFL